MDNLEALYLHYNSIIGDDGMIALATENAKFG